MAAQQLAAIMIQSLFRGYSKRKEFELIKEGKSNEINKDDDTKHAPLTSAYESLRRKYLTPCN